MSRCATSAHRCKVVRRPKTPEHSPTPHPLGRGQHCVRAAASRAFQFDLLLATAVSLLGCRRRAAGPRVEQVNALDRAVPCDVLDAWPSQLCSRRLLPCCPREQQGH